MPKKRLTITLDPTILKRVDSIINNKSILNRSHAIETILKDYFGSSIDTAIILAGGHKVKKTPLFKLNDKNLLEHQLEQLRRAGIKTVVLNTNDDVENYDKYVNEFGVRGLSLIIEREKKPLGTGGALKKLKKYIGKKPALVIHGDVYSDIDFSDFLEYHMEDKDTSTLVLTTVANPQKYGLVKVRGSEVIEFLEKPKKHMSPNLVSAGIYIINPKVFNYIEDNEFVSMEEDIFPKLAKDKGLVSYIHTGLWCDISYSEMYKEAIKHYKMSHS